MAVKPQQKKLPSAQRQDIEGTTTGNPEVHLWDHRENMKCNWKTYTSTLEAQVCELKEKKTTTSRIFSSKAAALVFSGKIPDRVTGPISFLILWKGTLILFLQEMENLRAWAHQPHGSTRL